ncbi:MAG: ATP-dependent sacrificial sulfur transferase LarE [Candidatus Omnitrophota bacterium]
MNTELEVKIENIRTHFRRLQKVLVAFSGGKDSFFLLKIALETLGKENVLACNVRTGFSTVNDRKRVDYFISKSDFKLEIMFVNVYEDEIVMLNPKDRCYFCKKKIFTALKEKAAALQLNAVVDGSTASDLNQYRPGLKALHELQIISPLLDAGITSGEIISYLKETLNIEPYYLTSSACLATRFPYDFQLDDKTLRIFDEIEATLVAEGIYPVKVRFIPEGIRIETPESNFAALMTNRERTIRFCQERGLKFVTLDLEGLKTGVWD